MWLFRGRFWRPVALLMVLAAAGWTISKVASAQGGLPSGTTTPGDTVSVFIQPVGELMVFDAVDWDGLTGAIEQAIGEPQAQAIVHFGVGDASTIDPNAVGAADFLIDFADTGATAISDFSELGSLAAGADISSAEVEPDLADIVTATVDAVISSVSAADESMVSAVANQDDGQLCFDPGTPTATMATPLVMVGPGQVLAISISSPAIASRATLDLSPMAAADYGLYGGATQGGCGESGADGVAVDTSLGTVQPAGSTSADGAPKISAVALDESGDTLPCTTIDLPAPNPQIFDLWGQFTNGWGGCTWAWLTSHI